MEIAKAIMTSLGVVVALFGILGGLLALPSNLKKFKKEWGQEKDKKKNGVKSMFDPCC